MTTNFTHGQRVWAIDSLTCVVCSGDFVGYREDNKIAVYNSFPDCITYYDSTMVFADEKTAEFEALKCKNERLQIEYDALKAKYDMLLNEMSNYLKRC